MVSITNALDLPAMTGITLPRHKLGAPIMALRHRDKRTDFKLSRQESGVQNTVWPSY